jgi:hypothetical protein
VGKRRHQSIELAASGVALLVVGAKRSDMDALMSGWADVWCWRCISSTSSVGLFEVLELFTLSLVQAGRPDGR